VLSRADMGGNYVDVVPARIWIALRRCSQILSQDAICVALLSNAKAGATEATTTAVASPIVRPQFRVQFRPLLNE
jgi:hypothetical protein